MSVRWLEVNTGQWLFSHMSHRLYDVGLYRFVSRVFWRCPTERLLDHYVENVSGSHLEVGVGSGYFLRRTLCREHVHRLTLWDLNKTCLIKAAQKLRSFEPELRHHNILEPLDGVACACQSVGMNYALHCIAGSFKENRRLFQTIHNQLAPGGVFFGATLLQTAGGTTLLSRLGMVVLNALGIFHNRQHRLEDLRAVLEELFPDVDIKLVGNATVFRAVKESLA